MTQYGIIPSGFLPKDQPTILKEMNDALSTALGRQVNVSARSNLGIMMGIFSERELLVWQLAEAVYWSAFLPGAENLAVDNQLAAVGLRRRPARATVTNPAPASAPDGTTLHGLVLYGTPGQVIPAGSTILTTDATPYTFALDSAATIAPSVNASQQLLLSRTPVSGGISLSLTEPAGGTATTATINAPLTASAIASAIHAAVSGVGVTPAFTDVDVQPLGTGFKLLFGGIPFSGDAHPPSSGGRAQPAVVVNANSLTATGGLAVNAAVLVIQEGAPAQAVSSATCVETGPIAVAAGGLSVIGSPLSGWSSVTNQLDCITGANVESDTDAMIRRANSLQLSGGSTADAIAAKVAQLSGVTAVAAFVNATYCATQNININGEVPGSNTYTIQLPSGQTSALRFDATAAQVQAAINAVNTGYSVLVTGSAGYGYAVDFNGSLGGQPQPLMQITNSTAPDGSIAVSYGRPPNSFELVVEGGSDADIAATIHANQPAGIGSYGSPAATVSGSTTANAVTMVVASTVNVRTGNSVIGPGLLPGTQVDAVGSGGTITLNQPAALDATGIYRFTNAETISDSQGNPTLVAFSRPQQVLPYVEIALLTDYYNVPGDSTSGVNARAKFTPASIPTIQDEIVAIGNAVPLGGLIVAQGSSGLVGAFNSVPGVLGYALAIGLDTRPAMPDVSTPTVPTNLQLLPQQYANFETLNVEVAWK